jgi:hypothetical protein
VTAARKPLDREGDAAPSEASEDHVVYVARMLTPEELRHREVEGVVPTEAARRWREENAAEIREYNGEIARRGVFGEDLRTW